MRFGLPRHFYAEAPGVSQEVVAAIDQAVQTLTDLGATVEEITLPDYELFNACGRVIMFSEAYAIHEADYLARPMDFGQLTYMRMTLGAFVTATDLQQAMRLRRELCEAVSRSVAEVRRADHCQCVWERLRRSRTLTSDNPPNFPIQTMAFNVTGHPVLAIPTGFSLNRACRSRCRS